MHEQVDRLTESLREFTEVVDRFPESRRLEVVFDSWSLREVLTHMAACDSTLTAGLQDLQKGLEPPFMDNTQKYNEEAAEKAQTLSWNQAYCEFIEAGEGLILAYAQLPENLWQKPFWCGKKYTPARFFDVTIRHYKEEHLPEILKFI